VPDQSRFLVGLVALAVFVGTGACEHADPVGTGADGVQPTLNSIQENIFSTSCALSGCHAGPNPRQGMNLSAGQAHDNLVNVRSNERPELFRVDPGAPDRSYLVHKIEGRSSIVEERMPLGGEPLSQNEIDAIRTWIENGASEN
jgi:hypothetical protein